MNFREEIVLRPDRKKNFGNLTCVSEVFLLPKFPFAVTVHKRDIFSPVFKGQKLTEKPSILLDNGQNRAIMIYLVCFIVVWRMR